MSVSELKTMVLGEKLQIMEDIWDGLQEGFDRSEISPQTKTLLDERRARIHRGDARLLDWDAVKGSIGRA